MTAQEVGGGPSGAIVTAQEWDDSSRLISQTDDNGNATVYTYDGLSRKIATTYADDTVHTTSYDVHDNEMTMTDANGSLVTSIYDLLDRVVRKDIVPGGGVSNDTTFETYKYDGLLRMIHAEDDDSLVIRGYDSLSRVTKESLNGTFTQCSYDGVGNMTRCLYPGGRIVSVTYDELERRKTISDQTGLIATYSYIGPSRVERREYSNGTRTDYDYDGITGIPNAVDDFGVKQIVRTAHTKISDGSVIDDRTYSWDRMYNKTQRKDIRVGGPQLTHDYFYDSIYRLVQSDRTPDGGATETINYDFDGVGNRTNVTGGSNPGAYALENATPEPADFQLNQYTQIPDDSRQYDLNGNLKDIDGPLTTDNKQITYDYRNQMVDYNDLQNGQRHTYAYDAMGRRIEKAIDTDGDDERILYFYDNWQVCEERSDIVVPATYVYGLYIDEVLNMQRGSSDSYYHQDQLYNVMAVSDENGNVVERYAYGDYGQVEVFDGLGNMTTGTSIENDYRFTGRRYDNEIQWYYYRTRYLEPTTGRFTTRDMIGIWEDGTEMGNGLTYVGNNPFTSVDPMGRAPENPYTELEKWPIPIKRDTPTQAPERNMSLPLNEVRRLYAKCKRFSSEITSRIGNTLQNFGVSNCNEQATEMAKCMSKDPRLRNWKFSHEGGSSGFFDGKRVYNPNDGSSSDRSHWWLHMQGPEKGTSFRMDPWNDIPPSLAD